MRITAYPFKFAAMAVLFLSAVTFLPRAVVGQIDLEGRSGEVQRETVNLLMNQERTIPIQVTRISVANPEIARVTELAAGEGVLITGLKAGSTEVRLWPQDRPEQVYVYTVNVSSRDIDQLKQEIEALLGSMLGVEVRKVGNRIVIDGTVLKRADRERIDTVKKEYGILDLTEDRFSEVEQKELAEQRAKEEQEILESLKADLAAQGLTKINADIREVRGERKLYLTGTVFGDEHLTKAQTIAEFYYNPELIVTLVEVDNPVVEIEMQLATVDQNKARDIGDNNLWNSAMQATMDAFIIDSGPGGNTRPTFTIGEGANAALRLLRQEGATYGYIQQAQAVKSGSQAEFSDGGELYFTTVGFETQGLEKVEFGFQADVLPILYEDGTVILDINMVNSIPVQQTTGVDDEAAVSLSKIEHKSTVETEVNKSVVLAGIDSNQASLAKSETPVLGKIPIINIFFKETSRQRVNARQIAVLTPTAPKYFEKTQPDLTLQAATDVARSDTETDTDFESIQADKPPWWKFWKWHND